MWNIKKINEQTKLNTKTDTENRLVVTRGEGAVGGQNRQGSQQYGDGWKLNFRWSVP